MGTLIQFQLSVKRLQRVPEQRTINSGVKGAASLDGLDATMTDDFIAAPFSMVSHITNHPGSLPRLARCLAQSIPLLPKQSALLKVMLLPWNQTSGTADTLVSQDTKQRWCTDGDEDRTLFSLLSATQV